MTILTRKEILVRFLVLLMSMDSVHLRKVSISTTGSLFSLSLVFRIDGRCIDKISLLLSSFCFIIAIARYVHSVMHLFCILWYRCQQMDGYLWDGFFLEFVLVCWGFCDIGIVFHVTRE